jgi:hypothetical protein
MDGDAKISFQEFELGMKSSLFNFKGKGRPKSSGAVRNKRSSSREFNTPRKLSNSFAQRSARSIGSEQKSRVVRPSTAADNRKKAMQQM